MFICIKKPERRILATIGDVRLRKREQLVTSQQDQYQQIASIQGLSIGDRVISFAEKTSHRGRVAAVLQNKDWPDQPWVVVQLVCILN